MYSKCEELDTDWSQQLHHSLSHSLTVFLLPESEAVKGKFKVQQGSANTDLIVIASSALPRQSLCVLPLTFLRYNESSTSPDPRCWFWCWVLSYCCAISYWVCRCCCSSHTILMVQFTKLPQGGAAVLRHGVDRVTLFADSWIILLQVVHSLTGSQFTSAYRSLISALTEGESQSHRVKLWTNLLSELDFPSLTTSSSPFRLHRLLWAAVTGYFSEW